VVSGVLIDSHPDSGAADLANRAAAARELARATCAAARERRETRFRAVMPRVNGRTSFASELDGLRTKVENLERALMTARRIGMALGILMARYGLTEDGAFDALRLASHRTQRKIRDIANDVVLTGDLVFPA
jgi:AmiR/NasT family two-component response regulator